MMTMTAALPRALLLELAQCSMLQSTADADVRLTRPNRVLTIHPLHYRRVRSSGWQLLSNRQLQRRAVGW